MGEAFIRASISLADKVIEYIMLVMVFSMILGMMLGMMSGVAFGVGASRAIFYPIQWLLSLLSISGKVKHPLLWDEFIYTNINPYPNGKEISQSFAAFAAFLNYNLTDLINAQHLTADLPDTNTAIRPTVLIALTRLGDIGAEIATYQDSTSRVNKFSALARAAESLEQLKSYANTEINEPERYIFAAIIEQWQPLITAANGEIGRFTLTEPIQNPYIVGNPVKPPIFVGREDIFRQLEALWQPKECPSVVLYGHRRMGKTSILKNLGARFGTQSQIIDFNMQRVGFVKNTGELLYNLAINIYDELPNTLTITEPEETRFLTSNPYTTFDRFLKKLDKVPHKKRLLITIDEFELIEKAINEKRIEPYLLEYLRGLIHTYPWFIIALAGLHTLEEMCHDYWNPLFLTVKPILVSFLSDGATHQLITAPEPDFPLEYEKAAIEKIIQETYNQPYLVQHICHGLVERFNTKTFEKGMEQTRQFTRADVTQVIDSKTFFTNAPAYFNGVWEQANVDDKQPIILKTLAPIPNGLTLSELATQTKLPENTLKEALKILQNHDIIKRQADRFTYTVALMQRWVKEFK